MIEAYPLQWPALYPRTASPESSKFKVTFTKALMNLRDELRRMGVEQPIISTNIPLRNDGLPYATYAQPKDTGVAVYFVYFGKDSVLACDKWATVAENLHALSLSIAAMRGLDRWGVSEILERVFTGFAALPAPEAQAKWWDVLGVSPRATRETIEAAYRVLAKECHPDQLSGSEQKMSELNRAITEARAALR